MKIAFATAQSLTGSTNLGRIMPLAQEFTVQGEQCFILALKTPTPPPTAEVLIRYVGAEPFQRTRAGKKRLRGFQLVLNMLATTLRTAWALQRIKPDVVIISKPLPANVLGVWFYSLLTTHYKLILDTDDFELTANKLSSLAQRAVIHWSERLAAKAADTIVTASPFLADHFKQLTQNAKPIEVIATGISSMPGQPPTGASLAQGGDPRSFLAYLGSVSVSSGHRVDLLAEILAQSLAQEPNTHLLIAGDGDDVTQLKKEFNRRGLEHHVTWHGRFTLSEVEGFLTPTTVILDPIDDSIANRSKSSFRVTLAAAQGLPVVTSNIGIRPELLPSQFHPRFFAEPGEATSYAEKAINLLQHPLTSAERQQLQEHAETYTWPELAKRYSAILPV